MQKFNKGVYVKPGLVLLLVLSIYMIPLKLLLGWFVAIIVHELSHIVAIKAVGASIESVSFGSNGALIETEPMKPWQEIVSAIAGPVGGFVLVLSGRFLPYCAVCAFIQSIYNLLPVYPLDGGRALRCFLCAVFGENSGKRVFLKVEMCVIGLLSVGLLCCCYIFPLKIIPLIIIILMVIRLYQIKFPCKRASKIVQ